MGKYSTRFIAAMFAIIAFTTVMLGNVTTAVAAPGAPTSAKAEWVSVAANGVKSNAVILSWAAPDGSANTRLLYVIWAYKGVTDNAAADGWKQILTTDATSNSVQLSLSQMGIDTAQNMSFRIRTIQITDKDTLMSDGSAFAIAKWSPSSVTITVKFTSTPIEQCKLGATYRYESKASASDESAITYSVQGPDGMKIDPSTGVVTWAPTRAGSYKVTITATSANGTTTTQTFTITVVGPDSVGSGVVSGTITDSTTGAGIAGATVSFISVTAQNSTGDVFTTTTGDKGNFEIKLRPGTYRVKVSKDGYTTEFWDQTTNGDLATLLVVADSGNYTINMWLVKLPVGTLFGTVSAAGQTINGASVTAILRGSSTDPTNGKIPGYGSQFATKTGDNGQYTIIVPAGSYIVHAEAAGFSAAWADSAHEIANARVIDVPVDTREEANIMLTAAPTSDFCTISGKVSSADKAISGAKVIVSATRNTNANGTTEYSVTTTTNGEGRYTVSVPCGQLYIAYCKAEGFNGVYWENQASPLDANPIKPGSTVNFNLQSQAPTGAGLAGTVHACDSANSTVQAKVTAYLIGDNNLRAIATVYTDSVGNYSFSNLDTGMYVVEAISRDSKFAAGYYVSSNSCSVDWRSATKLDIVAGQVLTGMDIFCKPTSTHHGFAKLLGRVRIIGGAPSVVYLSGAVVYAYDANNEIAGYCVTDTAGNYEIDNVDVGSYTLSMDKLQYVTQSAATLTTDYSANVAPSGEITVQKQSVSTVKDPSGVIPSSLALAQNYPNPFNPTTQITFAIPTTGIVTLAVYSVTGQKVATLASGTMQAGTYHATFDASNLPSGTYTYRLETAGGVIARQMVELK